MSFVALNGPVFLISDGDDGTPAGATGKSVPLQHDLVALPGGGFAVAWESDFTNTPSLQGIGLQLFKNNGSARTSQVLVVADDDGGTKDDVRLTATDNRIIVAWEQRDETDFTNDVKVRLFDSNASELGSPFRANDVFANDQDDVSLTPIGSGNWRAIWTSSGQDGDSDGIFARNFNASGTPLTNDVSLGPETAGAQYAPSTVQLKGGGIATAYSDGAAGNHIRLLGFGAPKTIGTELDSASRVDLAALPGGGVALAYQGTIGGYTWDDTRLAVQIVRANGTVLDPVLIESTDARRLGSIDITAAPDGGVLAAWEVTKYDGTKVTGYDVVVQRFDANGVAVGNPKTLSSPAPYNRYPEIATLANGDTIVTWQGDWPFGNPNEEEGLLFQRFAGQYVGTKGADKLTDTLGLNDLSGRKGNDLLKGKGGNDAIFGGDGNDTVKGGNGYDTLKGDAGRDKIYAGKGLDKLWGGKGKDKFVFAKKENKNTIMDFADKRDKIDLKAFKFKSKSQALSKFSELGNDHNDKLIFAHKGTTIIVKGIDMPDLSGADVII